MVGGSDSSGGADALSYVFAVAVGVDADAWCPDS